MVATHAIDSATLMWNPGWPVHPESGGDSYWVFHPENPVRVSGSYADAIIAATKTPISLTDISRMAEERGLTPFTIAAVVHRWVNAGYLVAGKPEPENVAIDVRDMPMVTHVFDRQSGSVISTGASTVSAATEHNSPVVLVDDLTDVLAFDTVPGPAHVVCLRGSSVVVASVTCVQCLGTRHQERRATEQLAASLCGLPYLYARHVAAANAASVANDLLAESRASARTDLLLEWVPSSNTTVEHQLLRVPGCPSCDPGGSSLNTGTTTNTNDRLVPADGYRSSTPEQTWERYQHHVSRLVGAVPWVEPMGRPELLIYGAGPNLARVGQSMAETLISLRAVAGGKGTTAAGARAGALAEALERSSLMYRGDEPFIVSTYNDLPNAVHPNSVHLFSDQQRALVDEQWAAGNRTPNPNAFEAVPRTFDTTEAIEWSEFTELASGETRWVPASITWMLHPESRGIRHGACSNGIAAGNTVEEATLQGLLELVERDSVALWWYPRCHRPGIDLDAIDDANVAAARRAVHRADHRVWVLDLTSDTGVPTCVAVSATLDGRGVLFGCGAHLDSHIAITRALTELAQIIGFWELNDKHGDSEQEWFDNATVESEPWLLPTHLILPAEQPHFESVTAALDSLVGTLHAMGMEVLVKNCTRSDLGLPVVRTIVPGLRHFWNRFAPGRLYDVPPRIGWREGPYGEADLNSWNFFL